MTEAEWIVCEDPQQLLECVGQVSDRKLRLFVCEIARTNSSMAGSLTNMITVAERYADGEATDEELQRVVDPLDYFEVPAANFAMVHLRPLSVDLAVEFARLFAARSAPRETTYHAVVAARWAESLRHCHILRDVLGNPFRDVKVDPIWLVWNDQTVRHIAQAIYQNYAFDRLPILADALEDAGCDNADILNHCRSGGEHVHGCWVIDLLRSVD